MSGFARVASFATAEEQGRASFCSFRKVPGQASTAGGWVDLSMAAGNPRPNYYATTPLTAARLDAFNGILHGDAKLPSTKHIAQLGTMVTSANTAGATRLCDYLLYYPFIDGDDTDTQSMDNTLGIERYTSGEGVRVLAVCVAPTTGGGSFVMNYTDSDGNPQVSATISCNPSATNIAEILTGAQGGVAGGQVFVPLASRGVRSIESVQMITPSGGLFALVLVKPLASAVTREANTMHEVDFTRTTPGAPRVEDGAYLNFLLNCAGSVAATTFAGYVRFYWSE